MTNEIERLTAAMSQKLDLWQTQQEKMSRNLIKKVQAAIRASAEPGPGIPRHATVPTPMDRAPSPADLPRTVRVSSSRPPVGTPRHFYAVVRGHTTGIITEWKAVLASISDFPVAKYTSFRDRARAEEWYLEQLQLLGINPPDQDLSDDDLSEEATVDYNAHGMPPWAARPQRRQPSTRTLSTNLPTEAARVPSHDLVDFRMAGPDPSTGDPKKIHDVAINSTSEVRDLLCRKA
jgi:hypothetical protein